MRPPAAPDPLDALRSAALPAPAPAGVRPAQRLLIAGAGGPLGRAVLERALGGARWAEVAVLTRGPLQPGVRGLHPLAHRADVDDPIEADAALVVFDRGRDFHGRDAAYHLPEPAELPRLARRLRAGGVHTLAVVGPVAPAGLPLALQHGLATLDEQAVAACGFERLLFVRPAQDAARDPAAPRLRPPERLARWMLSQLRLMTPAREQPVRACHGGGVRVRGAAPVARCAARHAGRRGAAAVGGGAGRPRGGGARLAGRRATHASLLTPAAEAMALTPRR